MPLTHHDDLIREFPEYKHRIAELMAHDTHFNAVYNKYKTIDDQVFRIEEDEESATDDITRDLKMKRAHLKDELYHILSNSVLELENVD